MRKTYKRDVGLALPEASWQWAKRGSARQDRWQGLQKLEKKQNSLRRWKDKENFSMRPVCTKCSHMRHLGWQRKIESGHVVGLMSNLESVELTT